MNQEENVEKKISKNHYLLKDEPLFPRPITPLRTPLGPFDRHSVLLAIESRKQVKRPQVDQWVSYMLNKSGQISYKGGQWTGIPNFNALERFVLTWKPSDLEASEANIRRMCGEDGESWQENRAEEERIILNAAYAEKEESIEMVDVQEESQEPDPQVVEVQEKEIDDATPIIVALARLGQEGIPDEVVAPRFVESTGDCVREQWAEIPEGPLVTLIGLGMDLYGVNRDMGIVKREWRGDEDFVAEGIWGQEIVFTDFYWVKEIVSHMPLKERVRRGARLGKVVEYDSLLKEPEVFNRVILKTSRGAPFKRRQKSHVVTRGPRVLTLDVVEENNHKFARLARGVRARLDEMYIPVDTDKVGRVQAITRGGEFKILSGGTRAYSLTTSSELDQYPRERGRWAWWRCREGWKQERQKKGKEKKKDDRSRRAKTQYVPPPPKTVGDYDRERKQAGRPEQVRPQGQYWEEYVPPETKSESKSGVRTPRGPSSRGRAPRGRHNQSPRKYGHQ